jgi:hypothetical protein
MLAMTETDLMDSSRSVYKTYKYINCYVISWLVATGAAAKCPLELIQRDGDSNSTTQRRILKLANFIPLAEWIERDGTHVPRSILTDLDRLIDLRTRYTKALRGNRPASASDLRHEHFISVLREVKAILQRLPVTQRHQQVGKPPKLSASFSVLDISDVPEQDDSDVAERRDVFATVGKLDMIPIW